MAASGTGVCVSVVQGAAFVVRDRILRVPDMTKLSDLLEDIYQNAECSEVNCSKKDSGPWINADLNSDVGLLANEFGCRYIRYVLRKEPECDEPPKAKKAVHQSILY